MTLLYLTYLFCDNHFIAITIIQEKAKALLESYNNSNITLNISDSISADNYPKNYFTKVRNDLLVAATDDNYPKEYIEFLSSNIITAEEFNSYFQKIINAEVACTQCSLNLYLEACLEDIFDALSKGKFSDKQYDSFEEKQPIFIGGHYGNYYQSSNFYDTMLGTSRPFNEILAEYVTIIKSPKSSELLGVLTEIMGQDFVKMLSDFYDNLYVDEKSYKLGGEHKYGL